ncbi:hypothetical protein RCL1_002696 [Eukaryota sp. TZLM3-RCL]
MSLVSQAENTKSFLALWNLYCDVYPCQEEEKLNQILFSRFFKRLRPLVRFVDDSVAKSINFGLSEFFFDDVSIKFNDFSLFKVDKLVTFSTNFDTLTPFAKSLLETLCQCISYSRILYKFNINFDNDSETFLLETSLLEGLQDLGISLNTRNTHSFPPFCSKIDLIPNSSSQEFVIIDPYIFDFQSLSPHLLVKVQAVILEVAQRYCSLLADCLFNNISLLFPGESVYSYFNYILDFFLWRSFKVSKFFNLICTQLHLLIPKHLTFTDNLPSFIKSAAETPNIGLLTSCLRECFPIKSGIEFQTSCKPFGGVFQLKDTFPLSLFVSLDTLDLLSRIQTFLLLLETSKFHCNKLWQQRLSRQAEQKYPRSTPSCKVLYRIIRRFSSFLSSLESFVSSRVLADIESLLSDVDVDNLSEYLSVFEKTINVASKRIFLHQNQSVIVGTIVGTCMVIVNLSLVHVDHERHLSLPQLIEIEQSLHKYISTVLTLLRTASSKLHMPDYTDLITRIDFSNFYST